MKKALVFTVSAAAGYLLWLKVQETQHRQAIWQQVTDPVEI